MRKEILKKADELLKISDLTGIGFSKFIYGTIDGIGDFADQIEAIPDEELRQAYQDAYGVTEPGCEDELRYLIFMDSLWGQHQTYSKIDIKQFGVQPSDDLMSFAMQVRGTLA